MKWANSITTKHMENKKLSAVEWLVEDLTRLGHNFKLYKKEIEQAKAMEKEQIIDAHLTGLIYSLDMSAYEQSVQYYNETYGK